MSENRLEITPLVHKKIIKKASKATHNEIFPRKTDATAKIKIDKKVTLFEILFSILCQPILLNLINFIKLYTF